MQLHLQRNVTGPNRTAAGEALTSQLQASCSFEAGAHFTPQPSLNDCAAQASLKPDVFPPQPPKCWDPRCEAPHPAQRLLEIQLDKA